MDDQEKSKFFLRMDKKVQDNKKCYLFSIATMFLYGAGNYLNAEVSSKLSYKALYPQWMSCIFLWAMFHTYKFILYKTSSSSGRQSVYFTKANSQYFKECEIEQNATVERNSLIDGASTSGKRYRLNFRAILCPFQIAVVWAGIEVVMAITFDFTNKSKINSGIISSIFSTSVGWTVVFFFFLYK